MKRQNTTSKTTLLILLSATLTCFSHFDYLTNALPTIKGDLQKNNIDLIAQKRIINLAERTLDTLQKEKNNNY